MSIFFYKEPDRYFSIAGCIISAATIQLCCCGAEAALDNKSVNKLLWPYISVTIEKYRWRVDHIWPAGHSLPTSCLCKTYKNYIAKELSVCVLRAVFNGPKCYVFVLRNSKNFTDGEDLSKYSYWQTVQEICAHVASILEVNIH